MLAHGHSPDTLGRLSTADRVELARLYIGREVGPLADARLLHAIYQLLQMIPRALGARNVRDISFEAVSPNLADYSPPEEKNGDNLAKIWSNLTS